MLLDLKERLSAGIFFQLRALLSNKDRGYQAVKKGAQATADWGHQKNKGSKNPSVRRQEANEQETRRRKETKRVGKVVKMVDEVVM